MFHVGDLARHVLRTVRAEVELVLVAKDVNEPWRRPRISFREIKGRMALDVQEFAEEVFELMQKVAALTVEIAACTLGIMVYVVEIINILQYWLLVAGVELYERIWETIRRRVWYPIEEALDRWTWRGERRRTPAV